MIKHIVCFKLKGSAEERRKTARAFVDAILALPEKIECLRHVEAGVNVNPNEKWDVTLIATLDNLDDVNVYAKHPAHVAAAALLADFKEERACVDFEC